MNILLDYIPLSITNARQLFSQTVLAIPMTFNRWTLLQVTFTDVDALGWTMKQYAVHCSLCCLFRVCSSRREKKVKGNFRFCCFGFTYVG